MLSFTNLLKLRPKWQNENSDVKVKGQSGIETFIVVFILGLLFLYSFIVYVDRNREIRWSGATMAARIECYKISSLINRVRFNGLGFSESSSFTHDIEVYGNKGGIEVVFNAAPIDPSNNEHYYCTFSTSNVTNSTDFTFGVFGDYRIVNEGTNITFYKI